MASTEVPSWEEAIDAALAANDGTKRPKTLRGLAAALENQVGSNQTASSWQTTLKRIRREDSATEAMAALIAKALQVPRERLPPAGERLTLRSLRAEVEGEVSDLRGAVLALIEVAQGLSREVEGLGGKAPTSELAAVQAVLRRRA